jgi:hypothetical protein
MQFLLSSALVLVSKRERFRDGSGKGSQSGTLYVPSLQVEKNIFGILERKADALQQLPIRVDKNNCLVSVGSHGCLTVPDSSIDYIFTDPPFGEPLQYGELNFFHEAWLRVITDLPSDCVINYVHGKDLSFYSQRMKRAFREAYRILKPGRWITVEFHNTQNSVWMAIQEALEAAGFVVADVRVLDKQEGSFNQVTRAGAVKKDLVISAYRPNGGLEERFELEKGTAEGVWDFVHTHLRQLPVFVSNKGLGEAIAERQAYMLFDRMVAFHVQRGILVPISAAEFYEGLTQSHPFEYRDGMYFLSDQVDEYDKKKQSVSELRQLELIVRDEQSAIQWLRQQLAEKPQRFSELQPQFMRETAGWSKDEQRMELSEILRLNFFCCDGEGEVPTQIRSYLSKNFHDLRGLAKDAPSLQEKAKDRWYVPDPNRAVDLEKIRERDLLKTFEEYRSSGVKKIKVPRLEALRAGFKRAWDQRDYATIVEVAAKIPESILQEDAKLLMFYDNAATRLGAG